MLAGLSDPPCQRTLSSLLPLMAMADTAHAEEQMEALEVDFFDKYWPGAALSMGGDSTVAPSEDLSPEAAAATRAAKQAKTNEQKGAGARGGKGWGPQPMGKRRDRDQGYGSRGWDTRSWSGWGTENTEEQGGSKDKTIKALRKEIDRLKDHVFALQRMALRQEDFSSCIKADLAWVMFMKLDMKASVVPCLYAMQQNWREIKANHPEKLSAPMRVDLVKALFKEFGNRLTLILQSDEQMASLVKLGWMNKEPLSWNYVQWNPDVERLCRIPDKEPIAFERVVAIAGAMQQLACTAGAITRFHPSREMEERMGGKVLTFSLQISILGEAAKSIREHLDLLSGLAATQMIGANMRRERPGRSALANLIQKQISGS